MSNIIQALENDMALLVYRHSLVSGAEFLQCAHRVAVGYYAETDLDDYHVPKRFAEAVARELERLDAIAQ